MTISLSELETLAVGFLALVIATAIAQNIPLLSRINVPAPVIGGVLVAIIVALLNSYGGISIQFAGELTIFFLLISSPRWACPPSFRR